ncbi:MAG: S1C family serine protease [Myxococcota bacterium]
MYSLEGVSQAVSELVSRVEPSIVSVESRRACGASSASGLVWAPNLVVTAAHALDRDEKLSVVLSGGQRVDAERVGVFPAGDLALLRVNAQLTPFAAVAQAPLALGELVLALGRVGQRLRVNLGIVSFLGGEWRLGQGVRVDRYIESDIAPSPALSAGPLVRANGELVGVNSARLARGALVTLPASSVVRVVDALSQKGRVARAELGVAVHPVRLPEKLAERLGQASGLIVLNVKSASSAERAGVMLGDVLLKLGDVALAGVEELEGALGEPAIGSALALRVVRGGSELDLRVDLQEKS